jgi:hypothetical protein
VEGTPGSSLGADATGTTTGGDGEAFYGDAVAIGKAAPVGDIFSRVVIDFFGGGIDDATWVMDTDSVGLPGGGVPEPSTWAMIVGGLLAVGASRFRRA